MTASMKSCLKDRKQACCPASHLELTHDRKIAVKPDSKTVVFHARLTATKNERMQARQPDIVQAQFPACMNA
jgi:hypothetical protein